MNTLTTVRPADMHDRLGSLEGEVVESIEASAQAITLRFANGRSLQVTDGSVTISTDPPVTHYLVHYELGGKPHTETFPTQKEQSDYLDALAKENIEAKAEEVIEQ